MSCLLPLLFSMEEVATSVCFHSVWIAAAGFLNKRKSTGFDVPQCTVHTGAQNIYKGLVQSYD